MHDLIVSQFHAALAMLRFGLTNVNDALWCDATLANPYWRIAYHVVFYADLYTSPSIAAFKPRALYAPGLHYLDEPIANADAPPCTPADLLGILDDVDGAISERVAAVPLDESSGFDWISLSRAELHVYNIRHIQHHAAQLMDRLRNAGLDPGRWVGRGSTPAPHSA